MIANHSHLSGWSASIGVEYKRWCTKKKSHINDFRSPRMSNQSLSNRAIAVCSEVSETEVHADCTVDTADPPRHGDDCALSDDIETLYRDYSGTLTSAIRSRYGNGPPDPEDVVQEAFQRVIARGDWSSISNLKAFIWRTARNLIFKETQRKEIRARHDFEIEQIFFPIKGDDSNPERIISAKEQLKSINEVLRNMPEKRRRALILHRVEGLSVAEVGRRLGICRTAAAKHVSRGAAEINALFIKDSEH